ncbi:MAG: TolC family protein [Acidobacteria bacterium]|nr:TolC family protein [Acidobacteriota bacterium]
MHSPNRAATLALLLAAMGLGSAQEWTEAVVVQKFLDQSPQAREARARVAITEAETRGRTLYANPSVNYSREGAGRTEFFQAEQSLPLTGRLKLLRHAGAAMVAVTEAEGAFSLWQARSSLRRAFYRVLAAQQSESIYASGLKDIENVIRVLADREREGEGSKFDRLRTERERAELLAELALLRAATALERAQLLAFLPDGTDIGALSGQIEAQPLVLNGTELTQRALALRDDYRAEQRRLEQYQLERRAAERLRFPEPILNAGLKRADIGPRVASGPVVGITIPLPLFNKGQTEVARYSAEQERTSARLDVLARQIRAAVDGAIQAFTIRRRAHDEYRSQLAGTGPELVRIATVAYQEGEIGILQLLDAYRVQRQAQLRMLAIQAAVKESQIELERVIGEEFGR